MFSHEIPTLYFSHVFHDIFLFYFCLEFLGAVSFFHHLELEINYFVSNVKFPPNYNLLLYI